MFRRIFEKIFPWNTKLISTILIIFLFLAFSFIIYNHLQLVYKDGYQFGYNAGLHDFSKGLSYKPNLHPFQIDSRGYSFFRFKEGYKKGYKKGYYKYSKKRLPKIVKGMSQKEVLDRLGKPMRKRKVNVGNREVWIYPMTVLIFEDGIVTLPP